MCLKLAGDCIWTGDPIIGYISNASLERKKKLISGVKYVLTIDRGLYASMWTNKDIIALTKIIISQNKILIKKYKLN